MTNHQATVVWQGKSGKNYTYWVHPIPTRFKSVPGNYIFAKRNSAGQWVPVYIGETSDLSERFENHHAAECIRRNGATHIHAHQSSTDRSVRLSEEADLRTNYRTSCNKQ